MEDPMAEWKPVIISIVMSVYNCAPYLEDSIMSLLNQSLTSWELILCDDGSTDDTYLIAKKYRQKYPGKIRLMRLKRNYKQAVARNKCITYARGKYIAIMDGDDTCNSKRLEREYLFLEDHPDIDFVGTGMYIFDENGVWGKSIPKEYPQTIDFIKGMPFCAATCLFRKSALNAIGGYREGKRYWRIEDVDLFARLHANGFKGMNIQEPLYNYREYKGTIKRRTLGGRIKSMHYTRETVKMYGLPSWMAIYGLRTILVGVLPHKVYVVLHHWKYGK